MCDPWIQIRLVSSKTQQTKIWHPCGNGWTTETAKLSTLIQKKFEDEWERGGMSHLRDQMMRAGQLKLVSEGVQEKADELEGTIASNDEHIIALALIANVKVLVSYREGDRDLFTDFKNRELVGGKVYTRKAHARGMLTKDTCP